MDVFRNYYNIRRNYGRKPRTAGTSSFLKVILMSTKQLYLVLLISIIWCLQIGVGADKPALTANESATSGGAKPDEQLDIIKNALLQGPSEEIRIKAANVMLFSENPLARAFLLDTLKQAENNAARMAVCKALIQTRTSKEIKNGEDFIQPLLGVFDTEIDAEAQLAAEATMIFEYEKIGDSLEKMATDASRPVKTRLNAIRALKLWPNMMATIQLIKLVDDSEKQVAAEAESALRSLGIEVGEAPEIRKQNIEKIRREGQVAFLRTQLSHKEAQMRQLRDELKWWRDSYLAALSKIYGAISDDTAKGNFLEDHLRSSKAEVRLWALEKVYEWRIAPGTKVPEKLGPVLINLISDSNRDVRLKIADLLTLMVELNSAQRLLTQLVVEQDDQVKTKLLVALGGACSYAILPTNSPVKISPEIKEIRKQTLEWAAKFLIEQDAEKARNGAEVIKKLLERDGLDPNEVDRYLGYLSDRYKQQKEKPGGGALRAELLSPMAALCAQGSSCKAQAAKLFRGLFEDALKDEIDSVRETAVDGLINIDKASALKRLRKDFVNDRSSELRGKLIKIAGEVGSGKEDLYWLAEKIGLKLENEPAWQAMLEIFNRSDAAVLDEWVGKLTSQSSEAKLSDQNKIDFLKIAEARVINKNKPEIRRKLADLYKKIGQFEQAAECLGRLYEAAQSPEGKKEILPELLDVYLRGSKVEDAAELIKKCLSEEDLGPNNAIMQTIDNYLSEPLAEADPYTVLEALIGIKPPQNRPKWNQWLKNWATRLDKAKKQQDNPNHTKN